jgi:OmpA-OmpF porin, OOP family
MFVALPGSLRERTALPLRTHGRRCGVAVAMAVCSLSPVSAQPAADVKGSRDHPMISRVEGSRLSGFEQKDFDEYRLVNGTVSAYRPDGHLWDSADEALNETNTMRLEGKVWKLTYVAPAERSTLEIMRSYRTALMQSGFKVLYECAQHECGGPLPKVRHPVFGMSYNRDTHAAKLSHLLMGRGGLRVYGNPAGDQRYLAAQLSRPEGDVYVSLLALGLKTPHVRLDVIEVAPLKAGLVTVNAAAMASDIATRGRAVLYGIYFDHDKSDLKPESRPTLTEMGALLKQNATLELIVVGHTDQNGTIDYNLTLSLRRAEAVVAALTSEFGIARNRLDARGVGFLSPVAPNTSDADRAKNRRVELIQRQGGNRPD